MDLTEVQASLTDATDGFKKMQYALIAFTGIAAVALLMATIAIFKNSK